MAYLVEVSYMAQYHPMIEFESLPLGHYPPFGYRPCPAEHVPARGILKSRHMRLPDVFTAGGLFTFCKAFRDMVEDLEPNVHQFFPFEIVGKDGRPVEGGSPFFLVNILNRFDSLIVAKSNIEWMRSESSTTEGKKIVVQVPIVKTNPLHLTLSARAIAGRHLWQAGRLPPRDSSFYISDELMRRKTAAKLKGFRFTHLDEVDEDWDPEANLKP